MKKSGAAGLSQYYAKLSQQLLDTVSVVRSDITALNRATVEALIVLDVHAKEVVQKELLEFEVADTNDFRWLS
jgi:dynein heavy chain